MSIQVCAECLCSNKVDCYLFACARMSEKHKRMDHFYCLYQYDTLPTGFCCSMRSKQGLMKFKERRESVSVKISIKTTHKFDFFHSVPYHVL